MLGKTGREKSSPESGRVCIRKNSKKAGEPGSHALESKERWAQSGVGAVVWGQLKWTLKARQGFRI